jgi:AbrB family looped-hinge helix DNA binding protein
MSRKTEHPRLNEFFYGSVTVGERGQVVIPAEARKESGFEAGDKLLVFRHPHLRGVVLAHVEDIQTLTDELQQWTETMAGMVDEGDGDTDDS